MREWLEEDEERKREKIRMKDEAEEKRKTVQMLSTLFPCIFFLYDLH